MKNLVIYISTIIPFFLFGQIEFEKTKHDFGDVSGMTDRFIDIKLTNKGQKKEYILSVKKPANVVYLVNGQFMDPDSSLTVRLQVNPNTKGRFNFEVNIFTSDKGEPTAIKLTGNLLNNNQTINPFQACPDFNSKPSRKENPTNFELTVITIDKETKALIENTNVSILQNGEAIWNKTTDSKGEIHQQTPLGFSYFYANHPLYKPSEIGGYINFQRNYVVIELDKKPFIPIAVIDPLQEKEIKSSNDDELSKALEIEINQQTDSNQQLKPTSSFSNLDKNDFNALNFNPINVTFVLDISASMRIGDKMELMKYALLQLSDMLREQDKISIVTYATETRVLLPTTSGDQKSKIKGLIKELRAGGMTAGGAGIKMGYKQTLRSYIDNGVNQIVIITDGDFNRNSGDYKKYIKKYKKKGINMSVVGVLNSEKEKVAMEEIAQLGGGNYIPIFKLSDAKENLRQEIRFMCFKP